PDPAPRPLPPGWPSTHGQQTRPASGTRYSPPPRAAQQAWPAASAASPPAGSAPRPAPAAKPPAEAYAGFPPEPPPAPPANWSDRGGSRARKAWSWIRPLCRTRIAFPETRVFGRSAPCALLQGILGLFLPTKERKHVRSFRTGGAGHRRRGGRSEEHTSELQSRENLVCRLV